VAGIDAQLLLCDAAVADPGGKLHMLGAGWSMTGSPTSPQAVAVMLKIPWDRANERLALVLRLVDSDGRSVAVATPDGAQEVTMGGDIEAGRPPGVAPGSQLDAALAFTVPSLPLPPGRYQWRLDVADDTFTASFQVVG
jgi:Family of unknown function (DUF6941)